jgi:two-component system chemotaxis response regulator CheB
MAGKKIRVLVIDDAEFMRRALTKILTSEPNIEVVGYGKTGREGLEAIKELKPDVVTLDIDMPEMDGITALKHIMIKYPTPVVVVSALTHKGEITFESLRLGVVDFLPKPSGSVSRDMELQKEDLIKRIEIASSVDINKIKRARIRPYKRVGKKGTWSKRGILVIGTSLGGPNNIIRLICRLSEDFPVPIVITQDISPVILKSFVEQFDSVSPLEIREAKDGMILEASTVYINSLENVVTFQKSESGDVALRVGPAEKNSIDTMMISAADVIGFGTVGFLFAGVKGDGVRGLKEIYDRGGETIVENGGTHFLPESNKEVIESGIAKHVLRNEDNASFIMELIDKIERGERR